MRISNKKIEEHLELEGFEPSFQNRLAVSDELENCDSDDYETIEDATIDAIRELDSLSRLVRVASPDEVKVNEVQNKVQS